MAENSKHPTIKLSRLKKDNSPFATPKIPAKYSHKTPAKKPKPQPHTVASQVDPAWRKAYRKAFTSFVLYFDDVTGTTLKNMTRQTILLGGIVEHFFSNKVTHLITNAPVQVSKVGVGREFNEHVTAEDHDGHKENVRVTNLSNLAIPQLSSFSSAKGKGTSSRKATGKHSLPVSPKMDIVSTAVKLGIKIWSVEKFQRVLTAIAEPTPVQKPTSTPRDMSQCLREVKVFGDSAEHCPFLQNYILVEDASGLYRPIACREYPDVEGPYNVPWPQLHMHNTGKSPFIRVEEAVPKSNSEESKKLKKSNSLLPDKKRVAVLTAVNMTKTPKATWDNTMGAIVETAITPTTYTFATPFQKAGKANSNASGLIIGGSAISNINSAKCLPHAVTPKVQQEKLTALIGKTVPADPKTNKSLNAQSAGTPKQQATPKIPTTKKRKKNGAALLITKRPGFCENCYQKFDDMDEHMVSKYHREFATDLARFVELDELLATVARTPKHHTDDEHHSANSWFSSDDSFSSDDDNLWGGSSDNELEDLPTIQTSKERNWYSYSDSDDQINDSGNVPEAILSHTSQNVKEKEFGSQDPLDNNLFVQKSSQQLLCVVPVGEVHDEADEKQRRPPAESEQATLVQGNGTGGTTTDCENEAIRSLIDCTAVQSEVDIVREPMVQVSPQPCAWSMQNAAVRSTPPEPQSDGHVPLLNVNVDGVEYLSRPAEQVIVPTPQPTRNHEVSIRVTPTSETEVNCTDAPQETMYTSVGNPFIDESFELDHFQLRKKRRRSYDISVSQSHDNEQNPISFAVPSEVEIKPREDDGTSQIPPESKIAIAPIVNSHLQNLPCSPNRIQLITPITVKDKHTLYSSMSSPPRNTIASTSPNRVMPPTSATCLSSPPRKTICSDLIASPLLFPNSKQDERRAIPLVTMARTRFDLFPGRKILRPVNTTLPAGYNAVSSALNRPHSPERRLPIIRKSSNRHFQPDFPREHARVHSNLNPSTESGMECGELGALRMMCEKCETWIHHDSVQFSSASEQALSQIDESYFEGCKLALCKNCS